MRSPFLEFILIILTILFLSYFPVHTGPSQAMGSVGFALGTEELDRNEKRRWIDCEWPSDECRSFGKT